MVVHSDTFWWEDCNCQTSDIQQKKNAPICQHDILPTSTTAATTTWSTTPKVTTSVACPDYWEEFNGHCYLFIEESMNWNDSESACVSEGGHLASIHSEEEQDFVYGLVSRFAYWLGATCSEVHNISVLNKIQ
jgi:hypothetical protein